MKQSNNNILVITLALGKNYGGILQAYALQETLRKLGYRPSSTASPESLITRVAAKLPLVKKTLFKLLGRPYKKNENTHIVALHTRKFIDENIHEVSFTDAKKLTQDGHFQALITGSDQVWRNAYTNVAHNLFSFDQTSTKKLSYAASFGIEDLSEYTPRLVNKTRTLASHLTAISTREDQGVALVGEHWGAKAQHHIDPTLLIDRAVYSSLIDKKNILPPSGELFSYVLDSTHSKQSIPVKIANGLNFKIFTIIDKDENAGRPMPPVEQWLRSFRDAKYVVTDSFHGTVFAIIFNKPFIAIGNKERGLARFTSLLGLFGLEDRLITSVDDLSDELINKPIDWDTVNKKIKSEQKRSFDYLKKHLG